MANRKWKVTFKVGEPDGSGIETKTIETEAATERKAVANAWYQNGGNPSFWLVKVVPA